MLITIKSLDDIELGTSVSLSQIYFLPGVPDVLSVHRWISSGRATRTLAGLEYAIVVRAAFSSYSNYRTDMTAGSQAVDLAQFLLKCHRQGVIIEAIVGSTGRINLAWCWREDHQSVAGERCVFARQPLTCEEVKVRDLLYIISGMQGALIDVWIVRQVTPRDVCVTSIIDKRFHLVTVSWEELAQLLPIAVVTNLPARGLVKVRKSCLTTNGDVIECASLSNHRCIGLYPPVVEGINLT